MSRVGTPRGSRAAFVEAEVPTREFTGNSTGGRDTALPIPSPGTGAQRPFRVTIPDASDVVRYRVSLGTDEGPIRHADRRSGGHGPRVD